MRVIALPEMTKMAERRNITQEMTSEQRFIEEKKIRGRHPPNTTDLIRPIVPSSEKTQCIPPFELSWRIIWGRIANGEQIIEEVPHPVISHSELCSGPEVLIQSS